jgi:hypothetical protein
MRLKELASETANCSWQFYYSTRAGKWRVALPNARWGVIEDKNPIEALRKAITYVETQRMLIDKKFRQKFTL